jgi:hypothetical protein
MNDPFPSPLIVASGETRAGGRLLLIDDGLLGGRGLLLRLSGAAGLGLLLPGLLLVRFRGFIAHDLVLVSAV